MDLIFVELRDSISLEISSGKDNSKVYISSKYDTFLISKDVKEILIKVKSSKKNSGRIIFYTNRDFLPKSSCSEMSFEPSKFENLNQTDLDQEICRFKNNLNVDKYISADIIDSPTNDISDIESSQVLLDVNPLYGPYKKPIDRKFIENNFIDKRLIENGFKENNLTDRRLQIDEDLFEDGTLLENSYFVFRKITEWPATHRAIMKPKEYIKNSIKKSFIDRVKAYLSLFNTAVHVKEKGTQRIQLEPLHPIQSLLLPLIYRTGAYKMRFIKKVLLYLTKKAGIKFDNPISKDKIQRFIDFYKINMEDFESTEYHTFNEFFYRKLKSGARKIEKMGAISSPADARVLCYDGHLIKTKGSFFSVSDLLEKTVPYTNIVVCRLAPQDYHRFHAPLDCTVRSIKYVYGEYHSVHPINHRNNILKNNMRCIIELDTARGIVYFVAMGATLVGSIVIGVQEGEKLRQMDEIGYFAFGGSCIIMIFTQEFNVLTEIKGNTCAQIETLIRVGNKIEN